MLPLPSTVLACALLLRGERADDIAVALPAQLKSVVASYPVQIVLDNGGGAFDRIAESSLYRALEHSPPWVAAWKKKEAKRGLSALRFLAGALNLDLKGFLRTLIARRVVICVEPPADEKKKGGTPDLLAFVDLRDAATAERWFLVLDQAATLIGATENGISEGKIRSANGSEFHATVGSYLVFANTKSKLEATLAALPETANADEPSRAPDGPPRLSLHLDLSALRKANDKPAAEKHGNGIEALFLHGLDIGINHATTLAASLSLEPAMLRLQAELEHPALEESVDHWYRSADADTPPEIWPSGAIASLRLDRRFAEFYRDHERWLAEDSTNDFVQFDNAMNLFFGGRSFADEILPALGQGMLLVVTPQTFSDLYKPPAIRLPAFTLIANVVKGKLKESELATAFQSAVSIINLDRAGKGKTSLLAGRSTEGKVTIYDARFSAPEPGDPKPGESADSPSQTNDAPAIQYNATPALALTPDQLVIGSAVEGVVAAVRELALHKEPRKSKPATTELRLDLAALAAILDSNREALITDRMLKEGENRASAATWIDLFLTILKGSGDLDALLLATGKGHTLDVGLRIGEGGGQR